MKILGFLRQEKILRAIIITALLVQAVPFESAEAKSRRGKNPWQPIKNVAPSPAVKWPTPGEIPLTSSFPPAGDSGARRFSRSLDWESAKGKGFGFAKPQKPLPDNLRLQEIPQPQPAQTRLFQLAQPEGGSGGPITGAQPQGMIAPASQATPIPMDSLALSSVLKLPEGKNRQIKQIEFREQSIREIFQILANFVELNLMISNGVDGNVTVTFHNITLEEAMNTLLKSQNLAFGWDGPILRIYQGANAPTSTAVFNIRNTSASQLKPVIDRMLTPDRGRSEVDTRLNALMVTDTPAILDAVRLLLPQIDVVETGVQVSARPLTEVFYLDYVDAANLLNPINMVVPTAQIQAYSSNQASQAAAGGGGGGGRQDMMIITDTQSNLDQIRELIGKLDVAPVQVIIDAHIYEIDLNEEERLGINWQKSVPVAGATGNLFDVSISPEESTAGGTGVFRFGSLDVNQFRALLAMLKTHTFAKVLSNPVLTTLNNRAANITVGQAIPYVSASIVDPNTGQVANTVAQANANITLQVTPSVTGNEEVFLDISPSISSVLGFTTLGGNSTPNLSNRSAQTQVIVKNNHTIVIGGMIKTDKNETMTKVPFFGDIPGIGRLFQKKTMREVRTELIIFITPHIVRTGSNKNIAADIAKPNQTLMPRLSLAP